MYKKTLLPILIALAAIPGVGQAHGVNLASDFTDFTTWTLSGSATATNQTPGNGFTYSSLNLTQPGVGDSAGSGFAPTAIELDFNQAFHFTFNFWVPYWNTGLRGDGLTFTLAGAPGVGNGGSGLGYEDLGADSIAFAIDTFHFGGEPVSPSIQILQSGSVEPLAYTETGLGDSIRDPDFQWWAFVSYAPSGNDDNSGILTGTIEHLNLGIFSVSANIDFAALGMVGNPVYYGFTAANGLADDGHFVTSAAVVPVPTALWLFGSSLLGMIGISRRRHM
jgi:hypothetical protein